MPDDPEYSDEDEFASLDEDLDVEDSAEEEYDSEEEYEPEDQPEPEKKSEVPQFRQSEGLPSDAPGEPERYRSSDPGEGHRNFDDRGRDESGLSEDYGTWEQK